MTAQEAQEWELFNMIEPFPEDKIVNALAHIASIFANGQLTKTNKQPWKTEDFLIKYFDTPIKAKKKQTVGDMKKLFHNIANAFTGKKKKEKTKKVEEPYKPKYALEHYIPRRTKPPANPANGKKRPKG